MSPPGGRRTECRRLPAPRPLYGRSPPYKRCGLASAALAQLRAEHPGFAWHTLGGHERDARPFWNAVGDGVPGSYLQAKLCERVAA